jgi:hypothetical protein
VSSCWQKLPLHDPIRGHLLTDFVLMVYDRRNISDLGTQFIVSEFMMRFNVPSTLLLTSRISNETICPVGNNVIVVALLTMHVVPLSDFRQSSAFVVIETTSVPQFMCVMTDINVMTVSPAFIEY